MAAFDTPGRPIPKHTTSAFPKTQSTRLYLCTSNVGVHISGTACDVFWPFPRAVNIPLPEGYQQDLPVLALGMSTHAQVLRLRRVAQPLAYNATAHVAFPMTPQGRHAGG